MHDAAVLVDPEGQVLANVPLPSQPGFVFEDSQIAVGEGAVWVMNGGCVCKVEPETREVGEADVNLPNQMALGHRAVWVATLFTEVFSVNASSLETSDPISLPEQGFHISVTTTDDAVWGAISTELIRIDPVQEAISDTVTLEHAVDDVIGVGAELWVVNQLDKALYLYGPDGGEIDSVSLPVVPDDVAAGPAGSLWVLNRSGGTVTKVDGDGGLGQPIRVGADATDLAVGPDAVWVADHDARTIQRIDPSLEQTDEPIPLPGPVAAIAVDPDTNEVWAYLD